MSVHVIIGADDYLIGETAKKLIGADAGVELVDSLNSTNAELQLADLARVRESVSTPPFLDPIKVTWWKNVGFLPGAKKVAEEVKLELEKFAAWIATLELPENQKFILSAPTLLKTSHLAKALAKVADIVTFAAEKPWEAERNAAVRVIDLAEELSLKFESGAAERFVAKVGTDTRSLVSELTKLRDYLGAGNTTIRAVDVDEISSAGAGVEPMPWGVTDAIGERNLDKALAELRKYESQSGYSVYMSAIIEGFFRNMIAFLEGSAEVGNQAWKLKNFVRNWNLKELQAARARFLRLRERTVSGRLVSGDEVIVCELVRVMRRKAAR